MSLQTDLREQPRVETTRTTVTRVSPVASVWVRGAFAATWAVLVGVAALVVLALIVWAADSHSGATATDATRFAAQLWLLSERTPWRVPGGTIAIPPLGLTLMMGLLLIRATSLVARSAAVRTSREVGSVVLAVTGPYAVLATALAFASRSGSIRPSAGAAFVCAIVVGGLASTLGALLGAGLVRVTWRGLAPDVRAAVEAAAAAAVVLVSAATVLLLVSLVAHAHEISTIARSYPSAPGQFAMLLLSVTMLPNAVIFSVSYLVGPGFAVGAGTSVGVGSTHLGAVPAFPLLGALPSGPAGLVVRLLAVVVVLAAGAAAGWRVSVRAADQSRRSGLRDQLRTVGLSAAIVGVSLAVIGGFAGGPSGPGRLRAVGPSPWQLGLAGAAEIAVIGAVTVLIAAWRHSRRRVIDVR